MALVINSIASILIVSYVFFELLAVLKKTSSKKIKSYLILIGVIHFFMAFVFYYIIDKQDASIDAVRFYKVASEAENWEGLFGLGNVFMSFLIYPFIKIKLTLAFLFLFFSAISFKGILMYLELIGIQKLHYKNTWLLLLFLTPSLHFWTGFVGKEALLLVLMVIVLKKVKSKNFDWQFLLVFISIFLLRPHVFFIMLLSLGILFLIDKHINYFQKRNLIIVTVVLFLILIPVFLHYFLGIEKLNITSLKAYIESFLSYTENRGNASISLANTTLIERIFYLVLMPLPFLYSTQNKLQLIVSVENVYYLSIFIFAIIYYFRKGLKFKQINIELKYALITSFLLIVLFGSYLYNLGLGNRMRIMFFPYIFYFLIQTIPEKFNHAKKTY